MSKVVEGFSKLNKDQKIDWLAANFLDNNSILVQNLKQYWNTDSHLQKLHDEFAENTLSNFYMPFGIAPNFLIDGKIYALPMAIEESSVVAAASKAAKFWLDKGGFHTKILSHEKVGHIHFSYKGDVEKLKNVFNKELKDYLWRETDSITKNMRKRGGGITQIELNDKRKELENYFQIEVNFDTVDAMGANFINSVLEQMAKKLEEFLFNEGIITSKEDYCTIMCILSNYTPNCIARAEVFCPVDQLYPTREESIEFVEKFSYALSIAHVEPYRAVTHNKGIMNGVDAIVIATGNDFRAVEACAHAYAAKNGRYASLTHCEVKDGQFRFWLDLPIAVGTVGGLTNLHPLVSTALKMLDSPGAEELMRIVAVGGLAQNFAALQSLVTTGIQKGHMKMHLFNILKQLAATEEEKKYFLDFFKDKIVSYHLVEEELSKLRNK